MKNAKFVCSMCSVVQIVNFETVPTIELAYKLFNKHCLLGTQALQIPTRSRSYLDAERTSLSAWVPEKYKESKESFSSIVSQIAMIGRITVNLLRRHRFLGHSANCNTVTVWASIHVQSPKLFSLVQALKLSGWKVQSETWERSLETL